MNDDGHPAPSVWILVGDKGGDTAQLRLLTRALGWPTTEKPLTFNVLYRLPNRLLGASRVALAEAGDAALAPPWPDLVLSAGRRATPVARWIRARSGGRTKLVNVGRPWGPVAAFDLVIAMPQYRLPARANILHVRLPFNRIDPAAMAGAAADWMPRLQGLPRRRIALLVGGRARPLRFDGAVATAIARQVDALAKQQDAAILMVTSRRTPAAVAEALASGITAPMLSHPWRAGDLSNAYAAFLGAADRLVVTGDSASMIAEACRTGKPVTVAPVPLDESLRERIPRLLEAVIPPATLDALHAGGWIVRPREIAALWRPLARDRHLHVLGEPMADTTPPPDDLPVALGRIRALLR